MKIYDQMKQVLAGREGEIINATELRRKLQLEYDTKPGSIILSDFCYNRYNFGVGFNKHLFEYLTRSTYKYLGENAKYTGLIYHKPKGTEHENVVGEWKNGERVMYKDPKTGSFFISPSQISHLYEEYIRVLHFELNILSCQPTELRHLIGRIGELYCAIVTEGQLAREVNQHGFDVISNGRKISVKTTAQQTAGFITFNRNTFETFDDIFIVQFRDNDFHILYHGAKEPIEQVARIYKTAYEVDLEKVKRLASDTKP
ncbi:hypothetical protein DV702_08615 [Sporosarcina sp. PTS2304]|uniref:DUF7225 domain-containing protein n=1 Tax=Sporosarcina sp. PTS2304 TaxID=2283194 RepID=UPI000E0DBEB1|nr:hypothetical protein [Sporosarcina sp. PTS2304]AXH99789.1 hypothetical protein DV702_08615 [Sporosarcina sp. PTS2304]